MTLIHLECSPFETLFDVHWNMDHVIVKCVGKGQFYKEIIGK